MWYAQMVYMLPGVYNSWKLPRLYISQCGAGFVNCNSNGWPRLQDNTR